MATKDPSVSELPVRQTEADAHKSPHSFCVMASVLTYLWSAQQQQKQALKQAVVCTTSLEAIFCLPDTMM